MADQPNSEGNRSQRATTLSDLGISKTQSSRWQKLAAVPEAEFEATFARPEKPRRPASSTGISGKKRNLVDPRALWLWGRLLDFERDGLLGADPEEICATIFLRQRLPQARRRQISPASEPRATRLSGPLLRAIDWKRRKRTRRWAGGGRAE